MYGIIYMWNLKKKKRTYLQDRNRLKDLKKEFMVIVVEGWGKG